MSYQPYLTNIKKSIKDKNFVELHQNSLNEWIILYLESDGIFSIHLRLIINTLKIIRKVRLLI